jgi:hypothetical protein
MAGARVLPFFVDEPGVEIDYEESLRRAEELILAGPAAFDERTTEPRHPA